MAVQRDEPYTNYNYLVDLGSGDPGSVQAGFSEILLPETSIDIIEYRSGNEPEAGARKLPGRTHYGNLILRRGVIAALDLYQWIDQVRNGDRSAFRNVTVQLQSEDRTTIVLTWKFRRAWPAKYSFSPLHAEGKEVLIESLALAFERMDME
ncbi:MAG: phage tail protein [Ignavibacteriae bacterium]|nr:phage tail protein [Ignavibacteriota bacterium]